MVHDSKIIWFFLVSIWLSIFETEKIEPGGRGVTLILLIVMFNTRGVRLFSKKNLFRRQKKRNFSDKIVKKHYFPFFAEAPSFGELNTDNASSNLTENYLNVKLKSYYRCSFFDFLLQLFSSSRQSKKHSMFFQTSAG